MAQAHGTEVRRRAAGWAVAAVVTCQLMLMLDGVIVTVALPSIRSDLGLSAVGLAWVVSAYALSFAGLLLVSGRLGTLFGPRRVLLTGVAVFVLASAAGGFAPTGELLIAARAVQGAGAALAGPAVMVLLVANTEEGRERLRAMAWFIIASSTGSSIGLIAGGVLTVTLGWRWVMLVNVPVGALIAVATLAFVREPGRGRGTLDIAGALTSALAMVSLVYGLSRAAQSSWGDRQALVAFAVAGLALLALPAVESRAEHPVVPLRLLRGSKGATLYGGMLLLPAMMIGFFTFSVLYLQDVRGYDALQAGLAYLPWGAAVIIGARVVPRLIERIGERGTVALGVLVAIAGALAFAVLAGNAPLWLGVLVPCFVFGFAPALFFTPATARVMAEAGPEDSGAAAGLFQSLQQLGGAVGVATLTTVFTGRAGSGVGPALQAAMVAGLGFGVLLLLLVLLTPAFPGRARAPRAAAYATD